MANPNDFYEVIRREQRRMAEEADQAVAAERARLDEAARTSAQAQHKAELLSTLHAEAAQVAQAALRARVPQDAHLQRLFKRPQAIGWYVGTKCVNRTVDRFYVSDYAPEPYNSTARSQVSATVLSTDGRLFEREGPEEYCHQQASADNDPAIQARLENTPLAEVIDVSDTEYNNSFEAYRRLLARFVIEHGLDM